ncbi:4-oxalomesaconate hydratase [Xanthomonas citri pv. citri]|uniref:4-oxalomesaconate hydratase n=1 Tax=Xanthomonas campestris pv. malvacearum TaxID=86040 RepID=A0AA45BW85_XANCM|nr:4-oxalomesaconate hydratase [Xanthomonas citri pv. citri]ASY82888.1 4-oxalomesaconate hydratase [Xanthomonas citri pv. malvacearum]AZB52663.1 4-oxalomesaconate hydratase [Xanthomonas citri pv. glycines str. 8ra]NMI14252.1 4-oxalomesaconate hydratase [Xanthomonas citri]QDR47180.1 4-oxalomesaconate hydratase [Xanthomonas citri pv. glycines]
MAEYSAASPSCGNRHRSGTCACVPFEQAIATQCAAIRAHLHIGTTTSAATCSVRAPGRPTLRTGNRWRAASAATHTPSP